MNLWEIDMYMKSRITVTVIAICSFLFIAAKCSGVEQTELRFYGKVIDQFNEPVADANVNLGIRYFNPAKGEQVKTVQINTDSSGLFDLTDFGSDVYIRTIEKDGYEFSDDKNNRLGFEYLQSVAVPFVPNAANPVVFHMRKKGQPAYLLCYSHKLKFLPSKPEEHYIDLITGRLFSTDEFERMTALHHSFQISLNDSNELGNHPIVPHADFKIKCNLSEDQSSYELLFTVLDTNSGVIAGNELLYEAPAQGYKSEAKIDINLAESSEKIRKYLYIKVREGQIYSRLDLPFAVRPDVLRVHLYSWTNPDGSRNLEYDEQFQRQASKLRSTVERYQLGRDWILGRRERIEQQKQVKYRTARERLKPKRTKQER